MASGRCPLASAVACLVLGCGARTGLELGQDGRRTASQNAAPTAVASSATSPHQARAAPPPVPPGIDAVRFAVLADICAVASWKGPSGLLVGCRSTPPFDGPDERPDGSIREANDGSEVCFLDDFYRGSFSGAGKDQAILALDACGNDRTNDITPGNVVLAERSEDGWRVAAVEPDTSVRGCSLSKRADRTLLVCAGSMGAFGDGMLSWRFTLDFAEPAGKRIDVFAKTYETPPSPCMMGTGILEERGVTTSRVTNERFADTDGDGDEDLSFTLERAHAPGSPALGKRAEAQCKGTPDGTPVDLAKLAGPTRRFSLEFKGERKTMVPTAATKKLLDAWGKEAPEFWWNVVK